RAGKAGIVILAGGMGSRLGRLEPKGTFPITPVTGKSLFQVHTEKIAVLRRHYGVNIPTYIMTNRVSHEPTVEYFRENQWFGLPEKDFFFFPQGDLPALNPQDGSVFYDANGNICVGPDGHGGLITALQTSGAADDMRARGIETINTFHVDNPIALVLNERFLEEHLNRESEMSSVIVQTNDGLELVGNLVRGDAEGKTLRVVEYFDFPESLGTETDSAGGLKYWAGSIGIHLIQLDFLERMARRIQEEPGFLPYHLPIKKINTRNGEEWGIKPERFIFDVLPYAKNPVAARVDRLEAFATLKKEPEPVRDHLSALYASWLRRAGAVVPENARVEIAPSFALDAETVREKVPAGTIFEGEEIVLE
ncbi:MAG: UTP--glucose-1-phosphate uridylyltransferase, partial [Thermoguttaceae bacterium]|nr:UTP--glucose-1-phosphate uridylyltransferase [Thermoguttaceae bacterium]